MVWSSKGDPLSARPTPVRLEVAHPLPAPPGCRMGKFCSRSDLWPSRENSVTTLGARLKCHAVFGHRGRDPPRAMGGASQHASRGHDRNRPWEESLTRAGLLVVSGQAPVLPRWFRAFVQEAVPLRRWLGGQSTAVTARRFEAGSTEEILLSAVIRRGDQVAALIALSFLFPKPDAGALQTAESNGVRSRPSPRQATCLAIPLFMLLAAKHLQELRRADASTERCAVKTRPAI
jgi:hypothetical protein